MEEKKYKLTEESIKFNSKTLYRIESLRDFGTIKKGDKGGFIESERNLSHEGHAWVSDNAKVFGKAQVYDDAKIFGDAKVYDNAEVYEDGGVLDNAEVYGNAHIDGIWICDDEKVQ